MRAIAILVLISGTLAACARPAPPAAPAPSPVPAAVTVAAEAPPPGELACKTRDDFGVVTELYLHGDRGTLRRRAPSGMKEEKDVEVVPYGDALIGDPHGPNDLAVHAFTLKRSEGQTFVRVGDWNQRWEPCL